METQSITLKESNEDIPTSAYSKSKLGVIGLVLNILGCIISSSSLWLMVFIVGAAGALDILDAPIEELTFVMYSGLFRGVVGGIIGVVSLTKGKSKRASGISIILGGIMLCILIFLTIGFNSH